ncbi:Protein of unknown function [Gryllus bimaculatus]|nr:Protein of unknown function [Gryllus bimaculatus]
MTSDSTSGGGGGGGGGGGSTKRISRSFQSCLRGARSPDDDGPAEENEQTVDKNERKTKIRHSIK